jgi:hypothetical protein
VRAWLRRFLRLDLVEVDDVVIVPLDRWHAIMDERDRLRAEVERLRRLVREGV